MMKIISFFSLVIILFTAGAYGQNFEGKIVYQNTFKAKENQEREFSDNRIDSMLGTSQTYMTNGVTYKEISNGGYMQWDLYVPKENRIYTKVVNSDVLYWDDASINNDEETDGRVLEDSVLKIELHKDVTEILGYKCDELILTCKSGVQKYYFNSKFAVNPNNFVNHKYQNLYYYLKIAHALPLKKIIETKGFILTSTAVEITPMKFNDKDFELPEGVKTVKNTY